MKQEVAQEAAKAAPPVTVAAAHYILGVSLSDWVLIATLIYTVLMSANLIWKWVRDLRRKK